ncbi:MAG: hypothetical protein ACR2NU_00885 [Aeoliella sp.]
MRSFVFVAVVSSLFCNLTATVGAIEVVDGGTAPAVYVVGFRFEGRGAVPSQLHQFSRRGVLQERRDLAETEQATSIATDGRDLYVGEFGTGNIDRYSINGEYLGRFAELGDVLGRNPGTPKLEFDTAGNLYASAGGSSSRPRTSVRLDPAGTISQTFSHEDLVFPRGIDAAGDGSVYILHSAGTPQKLFKFGPNGNHVNTFSIPRTVNASDLAINEFAHELYLSDEFDESLHVYDISSGAPSYRSSIPMAGFPISVSVEPMSGRLFSLTYSRGTGGSGNQLGFAYMGFELTPEGVVENSYSAESFSFATDIVAVVPEPSSVVLLSFAVVFNAFAAKANRHPGSPESRPPTPESQ